MLTLSYGVFFCSSTTVISWAFQPESELTDLFGYHLMRLRQTGIVPRLMSEWMEERPPSLEGRIFVEDADALGSGSSAKQRLLLETYVSPCDRLQLRQPLLPVLGSDIRTGPVGGPLPVGAVLLETKATKEENFIYLIL